MPKETEFVDDPKDQMPSQASERDLRSLLTLRLESSFPEGTSLDPVRVDLTVHESSDETIDQKLTDHESSSETVEDWDLRTPIAPPMTSLEGANVIFLAGTTQD